MTEIVLSIIFSGLLIVIMISVYFVCKSRSRQIKIIKKTVADIKLERSELDEPFPEHEHRSIEEKTFGRYKLVQSQEEKYNGRDNSGYTYTEFVPGNNQRVLSAIQMIEVSKKFSRLERVI